MAVPKIFGIETEYGIIQRGGDESNPVLASSLLINAYLAALSRSVADGSRVGWDFEDESPGLDARGMAAVSALAPEVETQLVNAVLTNGARFYVDHAHPEMSTPECADPRTAVVFDRAGELILEQAMQAASRMLPPGEEIVVYKNNSDRKGNSYGCHENYLMDRQVPFGRIVTHAITHFVTRQIYTGAGKVGSEAPNVSSRKVPFQITQRADFFEEEVGLETTLKRPIVNTRDEPHADPMKYRRLHVIVGDANMSEVATLLKLGTTSIMLSMIEDGWLRREFVFAAPVRALRQVSYDLTLAQPLELIDGSTMTALEIQWELLDAARKYAQEIGLESVGQAAGTEVLERWEQALTGLESDPQSMAGTIDWVAKHRLIDGYRQRHDLGWNDPRLAAMDLQYHDLRPDRSLARRVGLERITTDREVEAATTQPPEDTRAYFRGRCLQKWSEHIVAANWDSIVFDVGVDPLRRVPMMEPTRGTRAHVGSLIDDSDTPAELLDGLGA
jgi:proteasome accessory factor PafA2